MSLFTDAMDIANTAFGLIAGENFTVLRGGTPGTYAAVSMDDLASAGSVVPGGVRGENTINIFISRAVLTASGIKDGAVLTARGKNVRVNSINDDGDNTLMLACESAGIRL